MKVVEFQTHMRNFARLLDDGGATQTARNLDRLTGVFSGFEDRMLGTLLKKAEITPPSTPARHTEELTTLIATVIRLSEFAKPLAKQNFLKDLNQFIRFLESAQNYSTEGLIEAAKTSFADLSKKPAEAKQQLNAEVIADYVSKLKGSYKDSDKFMSLFNKLKSDKMVRKQEAAAISDQFAYSTPPSTAKKTSLDRIKSVHDTFVSMARKDKAMAGRSAA